MKWGAEIMSARTNMSFYQRFENDIVAGSKTITLRDDKYRDLVVGDRLTVKTVPTGRVFGIIEVRATSWIALTELDESHARQENMPLAELRAVIQDIYPNLQTLHAITFEFVRRL